VACLQDIPHIPVLYREVENTFKDITDGTVVDCTMGYAGHSSLILESNDSIRLIGIDQDQTAIDFSSSRLEKFGDRVKIKKGRFSKMAAEVFSDENKDEIKGLLADIGVSSLQLDEKERGFSFDSETLDMRMNPDQELDAATVVNTYSQKDLTKILLEYGEVKNAKHISSEIVNARPINSAKELTDLIRPFAPYGKKIHPSTLVFQAIRIEVNNELGELEGLLDAIEKSGLTDAKIAIISFHSLEDRMVKQRFKKSSKSCICRDDAMRCTCGNDHALGTLVSRKPYEAKADEVKGNVRSRSAKIRVFQFGL